MHAALPIRSCRPPECAVITAAGGRIRPCGPSVIRAVRVWIRVLACWWAWPWSVEAQTPALLPCQGWVKSGGAEFSGSGLFKFALVTQAGTVMWSNSPMSGGQPAAAVSAAVNGGFFQVPLGDPAVANMAALPPAVLASAGLRVRVWFNDGTRGFQQLSPDRRLAAMAAAFQVASAETVPDASITTAGFAEESVTTAKLSGELPSAVLADTIGLGAAGPGGIGGATGRLEIFPTGSGSAHVLDGPGRTLEIFGGIDGVLGSRQRRVMLDGADSGFLELYDESGGDLSARLQAFPSGGALLLHNGAGTLRASIVGIDTGGAATLYQADGQAGVTVDGDSAGSGAIFISNALGSSRVRARGGVDTGGSIEVLNATGTITTLLSHSGSHGALSLRDAGGSERLYAKATTPAAVFGLRNATGAVTAEMASSAAGPAAGSITLRSAAGDPVTLMTSVVAASLKLTNSTGSDLVLAQIASSGKFRLQDADGFVGIRMLGESKSDIYPDADHGGNITFNDADWRSSNCISSEEAFPAIRWRGDMTVNGSVSTDSGGLLGFDGGSANTWVYDNVDVSGIVECDEVIINSDVRLKDVGPNWTKGLAELRAVRPVTWKWKAGNARDHQPGRVRTGVLAQALRETLPEAVVEGSDGYLSIRPAPVIWALTNACRELAEEREALDGKAAALANDRAELLRRLEALERRLENLAE